MISTVEVLKLMEAFVNEPNYTVWSDLSCNLGVLSSLLSHTDFHEEIQEFIRDLFTPIGLKLGWDNKPGEGEKNKLSQKINAKVEKIKSGITGVCCPIPVLQVTWTFC